MTHFNTRHPLQRPAHHRLIKPVCLMISWMSWEPRCVFPFQPQPVDAPFIRLSQIFYCSPVSLFSDPNFSKQPWCWASYIAPAPHLKRVQLHSPASVLLLLLLVCLINCLLPKKRHFYDIWSDLDQRTRFVCRVVIVRKWEINLCPRAACISGSIQ